MLSPGRLVWEKGHQDVIRAVVALNRGLLGPSPPVRLLIAGSGPDEKRLRRHARELGGDGDIEFRRSVPYDEMPALYRQASAMVLASLPRRGWEEQFGMVLAEALASGTSILAARSGAIPEVVGQDATLFDPGDWFALAAGCAGARCAARPRYACPTTPIGWRCSRSMPPRTGWPGAYRRLLGSAETIPSPPL